MEWHDSTKEDWPIVFKSPPDGTFEIPLRILRSVDMENLFCAGRCADGDRAASSAIRVMGTALATGEAAGTAAALAISKCVELDAQEVRQTLLNHGALLDRMGLKKASRVEDAVGLNLTHEKALRDH